MATFAFYRVTWYLYWHGRVEREADFKTLQEVRDYIKLIRADGKRIRLYARNIRVHKFVTIDYPYMSKEPRKTT